MHILSIHTQLPHALVTPPRTRASPNVPISVRPASPQPMLLHSPSTSWHGYRRHAEHCKDRVSPCGARPQEWCSAVASRDVQREAGRGAGMLRREKRPSSVTCQGRALSKLCLFTSGASGGDGNGVPSTHGASVRVASADVESHHIALPRAAVAPQPRAVGEQQQLVQVPQCPQTHVHVRTSGARGQGARDRPWLQ
jgi:hypothetical protein